MKSIIYVLTAAIFATVLSGCVIAPVPVASPAAWVPGHYGPYGYWRRGALAMSEPCAAD